MRTIKFRAWDKEKKIMIPVCSIMPLQSILIPDGETKVGNMGAYAKNYKYLKPDTCEIMQFTGLLDKNGKEIYEGDILEHSAMQLEPKYRVEVLYKGYGFFFREFWKREYPEAINMPADMGQYYEIIGNIYENPELIK